MELQASAGWRTAVQDEPTWWPFAAEFPHWHVWQGINGLVYARRVMSSPPLVVRGEDAVDLRDEMIRADLRR
jgi:hypothetical protein